jgi:tetratricopeptide (TPR) repeat protein
MHQRLLAAAAALLLTSTAAAIDQIDFKDEDTSPRRGRITDMSPTEVVIETTSLGVQRVPANLIEQIIYEEDTGQLRTARKGVMEGQYETALANLQKLNLADYSRPYLRQDIEYYKGYCMAKIALAGGGDKADAGRALYYFVMNNNSSYHLFEAAELIGDLFHAMGKHGQAVQWYGKLTASPWPEMQMKGQLLQAEALLRQENFAEADKKYDELISRGGSDAEAQRLKRIAQLGKAYCTAKQGSPDKGVEAVKSIIQNSDPRDSELFARAYNTLGVCQLEAGRPKEALHAFLFTDLLFYGDPDLHAEALYYLVDLWEKDQKSARSLQARSLLKSQYAGTIWASK